MASIFDVAKYILSKKISLSTWKLQKLCYYSQAWTLAWDNEELFSESFQAWTNGPVCKELFQMHQGMFEVSESDIIFGDINNLSENQKHNIDIILEDYGNKDAFWLREQTHNELPWIKARAGISDNEPCTAIITKKSMGEYYGAL